MKKLTLGDEIELFGIRWKVTWIDHYADKVTLTDLIHGNTISEPLSVLLEDLARLDYGYSSYASVKCECGAEVTYRDPDACHSTWCPKYVRPVI